MDVVHAEGVAAPGQTQEVVHIAAVVAVVERHSGGAYTFVLQDCRITLAGAVDGIRVDANGHSGRLAGSGGCPQTHLFKRGRAASDDAYLDDTGFDARAVNAAINFLHEIVSKTRNRAGGH